MKNWQFSVDAENDPGVVNGGITIVGIVQAPSLELACQLVAEYIRNNDDQSRMVTLREVLGFKAGISQFGTPVKARLGRPRKKTDS